MLVQWPRKSIVSAEAPGRAGSCALGAAANAQRLRQDLDSIGGPTFCCWDQVSTEMVARLVPHADPITTKSGPYVIIRPEGEWRRQDVLDPSEIRGGTSPLRDVHAA